MTRVILDLCSGTRSWSQPYIDAGYEVLNADMVHPDHAIGDALGDVAFIESGTWGDIDRTVHGILCAPPCTMFAVSGNRWRVSRTPDDMKEALRIVDACLRIVAMLQPKWWALENPIGTLHRYIGKPKMYFNPCDFGDPYTKKTCLWGNFKFPKLNPVEPTEGSKLWKLYGGKSDKTKMLRSMTPSGFAKAFFEANP